MNTIDDLVCHVIVDVIGASRSCSDICPEDRDRLTAGYRRLHAELERDNLARWNDVDADGNDIIYKWVAADGIPDIIFEPVAHILGARYAPAFGGRLSPDTEVNALYELQRICELDHKKTVAYRTRIEKLLADEKSGPPHPERWLDY